MAVIGLTVGIGADTKKFNSEIRKMDKSIRNTNQEVYNLSKSLQFKWDASKFTRAQKLAQDSLTQTEIKAQSLRDRMKHLEEIGTAKTSAEYEKLGRDLARAELQAQKFAQKLKEIKDLRIEELAKKFDQVGDSIEKAAQKLAPMSAAAAALLAGFAAIGTSAIKAGDEIGTTAQQLNISTKEFQRWQYVAAQTDVSAATMTKGIMKIQQALGSLAAGEVDATSDALRGLGFTTEQAAGGMAENFEDIIGALAGMEDATMQAYYANELFGARMGAQLIPLLNDGGDGLAALSAEFENFNYLTDEEVQSLDAFEDVWDRIQYLFTTIKNQIGVALLPTFQALADVLENKVAPVVQRLADWFSSLSQSQIQTMLGTLAFVAALAPMLLIIGKLTKGVGGLIRMTKGLTTALSFLAAHPIILVIAVIIGLMALLYKQNEEFRDSVDGLFKQLSGLLMPILKIVGDLFTEILQAIMPLVNILLKILAPVLTLIINQFSFLVKILSAVLIPYLKFVGKVWGEVFGLIPKIIEGVVDAVEWMINSVIGMVNDLIDGVNKLGKYLGITFEKFKEVELGVSMGAFEQPEAEDMEFGGTVELDPSTPLTIDAESTLLGGPAGDSLLTAGGPVTNIDSSTKDFEINVTVQNYGAEVDVEDLVKQFNLELAKQM